MTELARPKLRGVSHQVSAAAAVVAGVVLVVEASSARAKWACAVFAASLVVQLTVSALYHRVTWSPAARARMRHADHAMIFVLIAGTATPFALLSMPEDLGTKIMLLLWGGGVLGVVVTLFWTTKPKWLLPLFCVALGWAAAPLWLDERGQLDATSVTMLASAGALYSIGALCYALKRPRLSPAVFGYHELFHAFTVVAAVVDVIAVARISR